MTETSLSATLSETGSDFKTSLGDVFRDVFRDVPTGLVEALPETARGWLEAHRAESIGTSR